MSPGKVVAVLGLFALLCLAIMFMLPRKVYAQDIPPCVDADELINALKSKDGAVELGRVDVESRYGDAWRIIEWKGMVGIVVTNHGCAMFDRPVDYAKDRGEPA